MHIITKERGGRVSVSCKRNTSRVAPLLEVEKRKAITSPRDTFRYFFHRTRIIIVESREGERERGLFAKNKR